MDEKPAWTLPSVSYSAVRMLVLSALTSRRGYPKDVYRRFAGSLAATGFDGDIVIMTTSEERRNLAGLEDECSRLTLHPVPRLHEDRDINCYRYRFFSEYLRSRADTYTLVMLSDSRDVVFQRDISRYPFDPGIDLYLAEEEKRIGECPINSGWILDLYGRELQAELMDRTVLCSGTTIGTPAAILEYLDAMNDEIDRVEDEFHERFGFLGGIDQGIHNHLYHNGLLSGSRIRTMHNREGLIYTVGHVAGDDPDRGFLDEASRFVTANGEVCYCIHQFDRLDPEVRRAFNRNASYPI